MRFAPFILLLAPATALADIAPGCGCTLGSPSTGAGIVTLLVAGLLLARR